MKIVVLAAGTSTEREVSIVSGTEVCKALRSRGHQAILVDVFFGKEGADPATAFDGDYDVDAEAAYISSFNAQVKDAVASGREFFGPGVIELCKAADVIFMALHGANGEDGRVQAYFDLCGIPYTGTGGRTYRKRNRSKRLHDQKDTGRDPVLQTERTSNTASAEQCKLQLPVYRGRISADHAGYGRYLCIQWFRLYFRISGSFSCTAGHWAAS